MKKLLGIIILGLLLSENANAKNRPTLECVFNNSTEPNMLAGITGACELVGKGWEKEAIPINHKKKSFISGFFSKLFN